MQGTRRLCDLHVSFQKSLKLADEQRDIYCGVAPKEVDIDVTIFVDDVMPK